MPNQQFDERDLQFSYARADSTYTPGATIGLFGSLRGILRIDSIVAINSDAVDHVLHIWINLYAVLEEIARINVPAGSGAGSTPAVDVLGSLTTTNAPAWLVVDITALEVSWDAAPASGQYLVVVAQGGIL